MSGPSLEMYACDKDLMEQCPMLWRHCKSWSPSNVEPVGTPFWKPSPTQGVQRGSTNGQHIWGGSHRGLELELDSVCFTTLTPVTELRENTHMYALVCPLLDLAHATSHYNKIKSHQHRPFVLSLFLSLQICGMWGQHCFNSPPPPNQGVQQVSFLSIFLSPWKYQKNPLHKQNKKQADHRRTGAPISSVTFSPLPLPLPLPPLIKTAMMVPIVLLT